MSGRRIWIGFLRYFGLYPADASMQPEIRRPTTVELLVVFAAMAAIVFGLELLFGQGPLFAAMNAVVVAGAFVGTQLLLRRFVIDRDRRWHERTRPKERG